MRLRGTRGGRGGAESCQKLPMYNHVGVSEFGSQDGTISWKRERQEASRAFKNSLHLDFRV